MNNFAVPVRKRSCTIDEFVAARTAEPHDSGAERRICVEKFLDDSQPQRQAFVEAYFRRPLVLGAHDNQGHAVMADLFPIGIASNPT